jgi:hypothetical protein
MICIGFALANGVAGGRDELRASFIPPVPILITGFCIKPIFWGIYSNVPVPG